jgi:hypothetical protein
LLFTFQGAIDDGGIRMNFAAFAPISAQVSDVFSTLLVKIASGYTVFPLGMYALSPRIIL